ncbi:galactose mutarotase [Oenococcus sicerae]|uniref:Maltose epimerase n=1 Tax=Oenococcus sicerae TaxID=2203724 RepID=A0AAJ1VNX4_9LACO|nr:aldose epimerase family protein [Oenococcus sicerae]MDN6900264.1 galactose mutarotase [Oenococcus sicerae]QAS69841.1 galactose mutarotase [Oenococcus sicerae]
MKIEKTNFGETNGRQIDKYRLTNKRGTRISLITLGATWQEFSAVEADKRQQLIVGFDNLADYVNTTYYLCKAVGRVAGRIAKAEFKLDGKNYKIENNEGGNALHGGSHGFSFINWDAHTEESAEQASVVFTHQIKSSDDQYPGNLKVTITYTLDENDNVHVRFTGESDQATLFNPTIHTYFNVTDTQHDLKTQWLKINSSKRLELASDKLPTGRFITVQDTNYDFQKPQNVQHVLNKLQEDTNTIELDDAFLVNAADEEPVAEIGDTAGKRQVRIYSKRNAVVVFTTNPLDPVREQQHDFNALAIECQTLPDAIHHQNFGDITIPADQTVTQEIIYQYKH